VEESFYTGCPNCKTTFKVTQKTLDLAKGKVRCGACLSVFQATDYMLQPKGEKSTANDKTQPEPD
jgi:predicted Zn finger-like uncharacterized protein